MDADIALRAAPRRWEAGRGARIFTPLQRA
jgi:hypothetical protein